ncbi:MAG: S8 family serine peptidase [Flavobacteriales bacterium]|nr:S8 family serine peptidase [Flavobacteriales bacterium]
MRLNILLAFILFTVCAVGQQKYWVFLSDKDGVEFDPYTYFDQKAIDRRVKNNVPIYHETDKPLKQLYFDQVAALSDTVAGHSRWFNAMACIISDDKLSLIAELPFVVKVEPMITQAFITEEMKAGDLKEGAKLLLKEQTKWLGASTFKENNINGEGVRICIIDAGFPSVDYADEFEDVRRKIKGTWDFHKNRPEVYKYNNHGAAVLSCVAGVSSDDVQIGLAPNSEFLLARTELIFKEGLSEEEDWLMAVEWADKNGADIINSSLGYTTSLYFKEDMNGITALISRAGNMAASKGILVVNAAGNEGDSYWKYIAAPADADSVLTVGGINPWTGIHTSFSSYGPTSDKRMKPNVAAFGHVIAATGRGDLSETQGTSFASPLIVGYAACVMQMYPDLPVMEIYQKIEESCHLYPYFDYAHGYGIPNAERLYVERVEVSDVLTYEFKGDSIYININPEKFELNDEVVINYHSRFLFDKAPKFLHIPDSFISDDSSPRKALPNYVYYHVEERGVLTEYALLAPRQLNVLTLSVDDFEHQTLRVWYKGQTLEVVLNKPKPKTDDKEDNENDTEETEGEVDNE